MICWLTHNGLLCRGGFLFSLGGDVGGCAGNNKDKDIEFSELDWASAGGVGRCDAIVTRPCMELDMFSEVEPTPLNFCLAVKNKKKAGMLPLAWFFQIVKRSAIL